jgi:hypothetical protein
VTLSSHSNQAPPPLPTAVGKCAAAQWLSSWAGVVDAPLGPLKGRVGLSCVRIGSPSDDLRYLFSRHTLRHAARRCSSGPSVRAAPTPLYPKIPEPLRDPNATPPFRITIETGLPNAATITGTAMALTPRAHEPKAPGMRRVRSRNSGKAPAAVSVRLVQGRHPSAAEHVEVLGLDEIYSHRKGFASLHWWRRFCRVWLSR